MWYVALFRDPLFFWSCSVLLQFAPFLFTLATKSALSLHFESPIAGRLIFHSVSAFLVNTWLVIARSGSTIS